MKLITSPVDETTDEGAKSRRQIHLEQTKVDSELEDRGAEVLCRMAYIIAQQDMPIRKYKAIRNLMQQTPLALLSQKSILLKPIETQIKNMLTQFDSQIAALHTATSAIIKEAKSQKRTPLTVEESTTAQTVIPALIGKIQKQTKNMIKKLQGAYISVIEQLLRESHAVPQRYGSQTHFTKEVLRHVFETVREVTLKEVRESVEYSLVGDEATITNKKYLLITVKYFVKDEKIPRIRTLDIVPIKDGRGETMNAVVLKMLKEGDLKQENCTGVGTDGASANLGKHSGFVTLFKKTMWKGMHLRQIDEETQERSSTWPQTITKLINKFLGEQDQWAGWVPCLHCSSHVTDLGAQAGNKAVALAEINEVIMKAIISDQTKSPVKSDLFDHLQLVMHQELARIAPWHAVRWLSRDKATCTIVSTLETFLAFYNHLARQKNPRTNKFYVEQAKYEGRYRQIRKYSFMRWLLMLRDVLPILSKLTKLTQRNSLTIVTLTHGITETLTNLKKLIDVNGEYEQKWLDQIQVKNDQPSWKGEKLLFDKDMKSDAEAFVKSRKAYIKAILYDLARRFADATESLDNFSVLHSAEVMKMS